VTQEQKQGSKPQPIFPSAAQLPQELLSLTRWVGFRYKWNGHKWNKPPYSTKTGEAIAPIVKYQEHFATFQEAITGAARHRLDGVGLVFLKGDGYVGLDFDDCIKDGVIDPTVENWLKWFTATYIEKSVSGTGIHALCRGEIPHALTATQLPDAADGVKLEVYGRDRYFCTTGMSIGPSLEIVDAQTSIDKLLKEVADAQPTAASQQPSGEKAMSVSTVRRIYADNLEALRHAAQGNGNSTLNSVAFFAGRAAAAKALEQTEEQIKADLLHIVCHEWQQPHPEDGARETINSGWSSGVQQPLLIGKDGIITNPGHLTEMVKRSEQVLHSIGLKYFERNNELVNTAYSRDVPKIKEIERDGESVIIIRASYETIKRDLDRHARYVSYSQGKDGPRESVVHVPNILPGQIHDRVNVESRDVPFPTLDMVTPTPVLLPSGKVSQELFEENILYVPNDGKLYPSVPAHPSRDEAQKSMSQFDAIFCKFPFVDPGKRRKHWRETASYSVALSGILSLAARPYFGLTSIPIHAVTASTRRSGKTKIAEAVTAAALGHKPSTVHFTNQEELGKHLQPLMLAGDRAVLIDNVELSLQSSKLCILITNGAMKDRVLGESREVIMKNYSVIFSTGNNLVIGGDLTARSIRADIDPMMEHPEERSFEFDPVMLAIERHPQLIVAALTALRAYLNAGSPWTLTRKHWGGFVRWDQLVCGCLTWLGYADPYETRARIIEADPIRMADVDILEAWHSRYKNRSVTLTELKKDRGEVYEALLKENQWDGYYARFILGRLKGKIINGYRLEREGPQFWVEKLLHQQHQLPAN
jgi:hypothetical protein